MDEKNKEERISAAILLEEKTVSIRMITTETGRILLENRFAYQDLPGETPNWQERIAEPSAELQSGFFHETLCRKVEFAIDQMLKSESLRWEQIERNSIAGSALMTHIAAGLTMPGFFMAEKPLPSYTHGFSFRGQSWPLPWSSECISYFLPCISTQIGSDALTVAFALRLYDCGKETLIIFRTDDSWLLMQGKWNAIVARKYSLTEKAACQEQLTKWSEPTERGMPTAMYLVATDTPSWLPKSLSHVPIIHENGAAMDGLTESIVSRSYRESCEWLGTIMIDEENPEAEAWRGCGS